MLLFSIGLSSRFAEWCDTVALRLAERKLGSVNLVSANTLDEIGLAVIRSHSDHLVISARQPSEGLRGALMAAGYSLLVALDDPYIALRNLAVDHGMDFAAATRGVATSSATMIAYSQTPIAQLLRASEQKLHPIEAVAKVAKCLGFELKDDEIAEITASLPDFDNNVEVHQMRQWWESLRPRHKRMAEGALNGYAQYFTQGRLDALIWTGGLFFLGDNPELAADNAIDLAGNVRNLLFGPYIALPTGSWGATITLAISKEAVGIDFGIEVIAGPRCIRLAYVTKVSDEPGICRAALIFDIDRRTDQPICLRVANLRACAGGRIALINIRVSLYDDAEGEIPAGITSALGL